LSICLRWHGLNVNLFISAIHALHSVCHLHHIPVDIQSNRFRLSIYIHIIPRSLHGDNLVLGCTPSYTYSFYEWQKNPYEKRFLIVWLFLSNAAGRSFKRHTAFVQTSRSIRSIAVKAYRSRHLDVKGRWMHPISLTSLSLTNTYTCICACSKTESRFPSVQNGLDSSHCYSLLFIFVHGTWQTTHSFKFFVYICAVIFFF
jgi:hypothetical protein